MKNKIALLVLSFNLVTYNIKAQFKYCISINTIGINEYFNKENDKISPLIEFSYKIENNLVGLEFFASWMGVGYYYGSSFAPEYINEGIKQILSSNIGIACYYTVLDKKWFKINPMAGLVRCNYDATIVEGWYIYPGSFNEPIINHNKEAKLGILTGININVPIWKGIYANTNARYAVYPTAKYNKQNLIFDIGIGYMYQHKKKLVSEKK
jgi:hypothetical protein